MAAETPSTSSSSLSSFFPHTTPVKDNEEHLRVSAFEWKDGKGNLHNTILTSQLYPDHPDSFKTIMKHIAKPYVKHYGGPGAVAIRAYLTSCDSHMDPENF